MGKPFGNGSGKKNIPLRIAAVLYCLTVISCYFATGLLARYSTSGQSGGYARAAKFSIVGEGQFYQTVQADLAPGEKTMVDLTIQNDSEVAMEYTVEVTNETGNLPLTFRLQKKGDGLTGTEKANGLAYSEQKLPDSITDQYTLHIEWNTDAPENKNPAVMGMVDYISVTVTASQID